MISLQDIRGEIEAAREELRATIPLLAPRWGERFLEPEGENLWTGKMDWTPREAVEHAVSSEVFYAAYLVDCLGREGELRWMGEVVAELEGFVRESRSLAALRFKTPEDALKTHLEVAARTDAVLDGLSDADTRKPVQLAQLHIDYARSGGVEPVPEVATWLRLLAIHLRDHARQFQAAMTSKS